MCYQHLASKHLWPFFFYIFCAQSESLGFKNHVTSSNHRKLGKLSRGLNTYWIFRNFAQNVCVDNLLKITYDTRQICEKFCEHSMKPTGSWSDCLMKLCHSVCLMKRNDSGYLGLKPGHQLSSVKKTYTLEITFYLVLKRHT